MFQDQNWKGSTKCEIPGVGDTITTLVWSLSDPWGLWGFSADLQQSTMPRSTIPEDKINLRLIMVSGKTKDYLFKPSDSAGDIAQFIFDNWPEGKFTKDQVWEKLKVYKQRKIWLLLPKNFKELCIQKKITWSERHFKCHYGKVNYLAN